jgi:hypothetical protein
MGTIFCQPREPQTKGKLVQAGKAGRRAVALSVYVVCEHVLALAGIGLAQVQPLVLGHAGGEPRVLQRALAYLPPKFPGILIGEALLVVGPVEKSLIP